jgi:hypothetical protein
MEAITNIATEISPILGLVLIYVVIKLRDVQLQLDELKRLDSAARLARIEEAVGWLKDKWSEVIYERDHD